VAAVADEAAQQMPDVSRSRMIDVPPDQVWKLLSDPHNLPRWWPDTIRVESVEGQPGARRSSFTQVFETQKGTPVRADYRCTDSTRGRRLVWEQRIDDTPFEKFLRGAELEFLIAPEGEHTEGSAVTIVGRRWLRGLSRLGAPMMARATKRALDDALDGIEEALTIPAESETGLQDGEEVPS
jgi:uncharacterized protein YndB with AHSA1/START domain